MRMTEGVHADAEKNTMYVAAGENKYNVDIALALMGNRHSTGGIGAEPLQGVFFCHLQPLSAI